MPQLIPEQIAIMDSSAMDTEDPDRSSRSLLSTRSSPGALASHPSVRSHISNITMSTLATPQPYNMPSSAASVQSIQSEATDASLKRDREREGRCSECGVQTHEFQYDHQTCQSRKVPLTVEDEVHRGRCLLCHPFKRPVGPHGRYRSRRHHHDGASVHSINTVSTHGSRGSVQSEPGGGASISSSIRPDTVESVSVLTQSMASVDVAAVQEALATFDAETADICDIIAAMRRYPNEPRIQEKGCEKLWIQSWDDDNAVAIGRVGGITTILDAMRTSRSQHLHQCGCEALQNLALKDYNRDVIAEQGGIGVIIRAMTKNWNVSGIQQCGCTALANLAAHSVDNKISIAESGGLQAIMKAAENFNNEETVLMAAYQALRVLGYNNSNQQPVEGQQAQHPQQPAHQPPTNQQEGQQPQQQGQPQQPAQGGMVALDKYGFPVSR